MQADAVLVTSSFLPGRGGIESYLASLCAALSPRVAVVAPGRRGRERLPKALGYPLYAGPGRMLAPVPKVAEITASVAATLGTDRVLFGTPWPLVLTAPAMARRGLRYAVIAHGAELIVPGAVPGLRARLARALGGAELLLPVGEYTGGQVRRLLERSGESIPPIEILRARVDTERFHPNVDPEPARAALGLDPGARVVLCFGRLVPRKGVDRLVRAIPALRARVPEAVLVVAGTGPEEKRLRQLADEVAPGAVAFAGRVPDELAPSYYSLADVFALAVVDRYRGLEVEGLGVVLLEAAATETPCVTGRSGGTPEAVVDAETGFVVDATDEKILIDRIAGLLENEHLARQMGRAGRRHVLANFAGEAALAPLTRWLA
ncbi:MAG: glycosyltransferase family 4 protein [Actinomycetota bacterium]